MARQHLLDPSEPLKEISYCYENNWKLEISANAFQMPDAWQSFS